MLAHDGRVKRCLRAFVVAAVTAAAASPLATFGADDWMNLATVGMTGATTPNLTAIRGSAID